MDMDVNAVLQRAYAERGKAPSELLPLLHHLQDAIGFIPPAALPGLAEELGLSRAEVHGVVTFYHHFRQTPPGRTVVQLCRAEACQAMGSEALVAHAEQSLNCRMHETTEDGGISLEPVYCLGQCAVGPAGLIGNRLVARLTPERFDALMAKERAR
jgi:formate dehydrogenase subunit gamma